MMDRCAGIVLFCSALKEIIDLHYSPTHKTQPLTHAGTHTHTQTHASIHILLFHPYDCTASHMAAHTPAPNQGVNVYLTSCLL